MITMVMRTLVVLCLVSIVFYAYGINRYNIDLKYKSIHAEEDAMNKLKRMEKKKLINILVFRVNNKGDKLCMAKPCENCCKCIKNSLEQKNYKLKANKCWYTNNVGDIEFIKILY